MAETKSTNPYDHLLTRVENPIMEEVPWELVKTIEIFEEGNERIRVFTANPISFRWFVGCEICVPEIGDRIYSSVNDCAKVGYATSEQDAILFMLGRIIANFGDKLPEHVAHSVKQAIFNYRQRTLF
jgi:hypothetical protein